MTLQAMIADCEQCARREGWQGPWTLQVRDLDDIVQRLGRKLTPTEGQTLSLPSWAGAHVDRDEVTA